MVYNWNVQYPIVMFIYWKDCLSILSEHKISQVFKEIESLPQTMIF